VGCALGRWGAIGCTLAAVALPRAAVAQSAPFPPPAKVAAAISRLFGSGARVDTLRVDTSAVLRVSRSDSLLGFAAVGNVIGKDQWITFLVALDAADRLVDVDILVYREPYGGEVAYDAWRKQFRGKSAPDSLRVGKEIRGISGATISVRAVTAGVRRMLDQLTAWHRSGVIR
jgi:FMN-binding protein